MPQARLAAYKDTMIICLVSIFHGFLGEMLQLGSVGVIVTAKGAPANEIFCFGGLMVSASAGYQQRADEELVCRESRSHECRARRFLGSICPIPILQKPQKTHWYLLHGLEYNRPRSPVESFSSPRGFCRSPAKLSNHRSFSLSDFLKLRRKYASLQRVL